MPSGHSPISRECRHDEALDRFTGRMIRLALLDDHEVSSSSRAKRPVSSKPAEQSHSRISVLSA
jgi:hypothetical protein